MIMAGYCKYGNEKWEVQRLGVGVTPDNVIVAIVKTEEEAIKICREINETNKEEGLIDTPPKKT